MVASKVIKRRRLKAATTAAAESTTRAAATREAGATRATRRGRHHAAGAGRHRAQIIREHHGIEAGAVRGAAVPLRRLSQDSLEAAAPSVLHAHRPPQRQELLEHFG